MATVTKDFKIKYGLIVEGTTATVNGYSILTKSVADQNYIIGLIGGSATPEATPDTVVLRDENADFSAGTITADLIGNVTGNVSGSAGTVDSLTGHTTTDLTEGTQLYFTTTRARESVQSGTGINYDSSTGTVSIDETTTATLSHVDGEIITALSTAQGYANTAELNATTTAALDATSKANTAEQNAKDYADDLINDASSSSTEVWSAYKTSTEIGLVDTAAQGYATTAETNANSYTDGEITTALSTAQGYADTAEANANAYTDNAVSGLTWKQSVNLLYDAAIPVLSGSGATQLIVDGHDVLGDADSGYRLLLTGVTSPGIYVYNSTGGSWTLTRTEDADTFEELVGAAVYVMEGTQYGSTSWVQSNHYLTGFSGQTWTQFSGQGSVTAGTGITVDGLEVSVNRTVVDTWYDASGAAATAQSNAEDYADGLAVNYDAAGSATTAENNAKAYSDDLVGDVTVDGTSGNTVTSRIATAKSEAIAHADALTTSDIAEGTSLYFTTDRATDAAGALLAAAVKTNIQITYDDTTNILTVAAENGVADSTTSDLAEGSNLYFTNARAQSAVAGDISSAIDALTTSDIEEGSRLYFTDVRAVDALEAVVPNFTEIDINSVATQVAATTSVATASTVTAYEFAHADYRSAKFLVKAATSTHTELSEILVTLDSLNNVAITEYAEITSNGNLFNVTADVDGANVRVRVTTVHNSTNVTVVGTLVA